MIFHQVGDILVKLGFNFPRSKDRIGLKQYLKVWLKFESFEFLDSMFQHQIVKPWDIGLNFFVYFKNSQLKNLQVKGPDMENHNNN